MYDCRMMIGACTCKWLYIRRLSDTYAVYVYISMNVNKTFIFIRKYANKFLWKCLFGANTVHLFSHINVTSARVYSAILHNSNCNVTVCKHMQSCAYVSPMYGNDVTSMRDGSHAHKRDSNGPLTRINSAI